MNRRDFLTIGAGASFATFAYSQAADFPRRPITVVYPYPPGSLGDAEIRDLAEYVRRTLGQPLVIDYRPGASGTLASQYAMRQPADGYTILFGTSTTLVMAPHVILKAPYNARKDLEPVGALGQVGTLISVPAASNSRTLQDLIAALKANPGKLNFGSIGPGSASHLHAELFLRAIGATATQVAYKGPPQAQLALMNSEIDFLVEVVQTAKPQIDAGRLRSLGVADTKRAPQLPDVPTLAENGVPLKLALWTGFFAPKGTPRPVVELVSKTIADFLRQPEIRAKFTARGMEVTPMSSQELDQTVAADDALWQPLIKSLNLQPQ